MKLNALIGGHWLDGVDFDNEQIKGLCDQYEHCNVMRFRLDGVVYCAIEDPCDGYRSCMSELSVTHGGSMSNTFEPVRVVGCHFTNGGTDDVLKLIDVKTGGVVIEVGTQNVDDYYPNYAAYFYPEHMILNTESEAKLRALVRQNIDCHPQLSPSEKTAIKQTLNVGAQYGYGNVIAWLATEWACKLRDELDLPEETAIAAVSERRPYPLPSKPLNRSEEKNYES